MPEPGAAGTVGTTERRNYFRNIPGIAPPILPIIRDILPIFFIIVCIWKNLLSIVFSSVTVTPLPAAMRH